MNNPLKHMDPTGMFSTHTDEDGNVVAVYDDGDLGVYRPEGQATKEDIDARHNRDNPSAGGERMGRSIHTFSFSNFEALEKGEIIAEGRIDYGSTWAEDKIQSSLDEMLGYFSDYIWKANGNQKYDIKRKSPTGNVYYGSQVEEGVYASARDAGNILAGAAAKKFNVPFEVAMLGYGALNLGGNNRVKGAAILSLHYLSKQGASSGYLWSKPFFGENPASGVMQYYGYFKGGKK